MRDFQMALQSIQLSTGVGVRVAILDSGANPALPGVRDSNYRGFICNYQKSDFSIEEAKADKSFDRNGHGSIVQSCLSAVAPDVDIDHYCILDENNHCDIALLCYTLDHVLEQNYNIVNLSLGTRNEEYIPWLVSIMKRAYEKNVILITASSNVGNVLFPARFTYCLSVDAMFATQRLALAYHENSVIEVSAFGVDVPVRSTFDNEIKVTGTSYAAAHVSGLVARAIEAYGPLSMIEVKTLLKQYAREFLEVSVSMV